MTPETIGRYKIERELGRGAMGIVYLAADPNLGRTVALKTIFSNTIGTNPEEVAQRFKNEARAAGSLSHANIVTVFDAGEHDGLLYIAMELLDGETLEAHLSQRRTISVERAINFVRQVCAALDYANSKGIVHRDIKPANVMLLPNDVVKITDFGLARTAEAITMTGHVMGTPHYMSPEQVRGRPVDGRSDLFSVGVMLYEMLTGERPFEGQSITTIMYKIVHEEPTPPRALDASIPPGLSAVIQRSLAKSPDERYQTGASFVHALDHYREFQTSPTQPSAAATVAVTPGTVVSPPDTQQIPPPQTSSAKAGNRKPLWIAVAVMVLAIAGYFAFAPDRHPRSAVSSTTENESKQTVTPPPPEAPVAPGPTNSAPIQSTAAQAARKQPSEAGNSTATLTVTSNPPTAKIFLDGKSTGLQTPAQLQLTRGKHQVSVRMDGFNPADTTFQVKGGEQLSFAPKLSVAIPSVPGVKIPNVEIPKIDIHKLEQLQKNKEIRSPEFWQQWANAARSNAEGAASGADLTVLVNTKPTGAKIYIDGGDTGKTSPAIIPEKPGKYHVRVTLDGYQPAEQEVTVGEKHPAMVNIKLTPAEQK